MYWYCEVGLIGVWRFDIDLTSRVVHKVNVPVIASGGVGQKEHFAEAFETGCSAALAASIFHFNEISIKEVKEYLANRGYSIRNVNS